MNATIVIDAENAVLGRLASFAAKQAMLGKNVVIVNCSGAVITGRKRKTIEDYKHKRARGGHGLRGPNFPKSPDRILKRTIRGMLAFKQQRGLGALKRIICYNNVPNEYEKAEKILAGKQKKTTTTKLSRISSEF
jgi:large subunit ribosomal protein L13